MATKKRVVKKPVAKAKKTMTGRKGDTSVVRSQTYLKAREEHRTAKQAIKRVAPKIVSRSMVGKVPVEEYKPLDVDAAAAFALSIAAQMKKNAKAAPKKETAAEGDIRLTRRPTTRSQGKTTDKFPATDLKEFKRRLLESRKRATQGVDAMKATGFNESEDHEADGGDGTNQTLRLQALGQMGNINRVIQQIDEALHRIEDGTYGVCAVCGQLIRKPRLLNQPFVLTCMECQSEMERAKQ